MKRICTSFVLLLGVLLLPGAAHAQQVYADVNGDLEVNIADINAVINDILGDANNPSADVNGDGEINIADVNAIIDIILGGDAPNPDDHQYVDLGLPSGTLWATCNIGADSPEGYGDYFAWGETETKEIYKWTTYKWCEGNEFSITKYDPLWYWTGGPELELADDAAFVNWGPSWRMPSEFQIKELCDCCTWQWTQMNGVNGQLLTGPNGNTLFLPAAGYRYGSSSFKVGTSGDYWSRTVNYSSSSYAHRLVIYSGNIYCSNIMLGRCYGLSVRAVHVPAVDEQSLYIEQHRLDIANVLIEDARTDELTIINNTNEAVTLTVATDEPFSLRQYYGDAPSMTIEVPANSIAPVTVMFTSSTTPGDYYGNVTFEHPALAGGKSVIPVHASVITNDVVEHEYVDLGLPSGTLWATCNVGANAPEDYGDYFAWGETVPKDYYAWSTCKWFKEGLDRIGFTKYCTDGNGGYNGYADGKTELDLDDDAAYVNWGPSWRMPSEDQMNELYENCSWSWTQSNGVYGELFTGPNGNTMFLPAAGFFSGSSRYYSGSNGDGAYWSRTVEPEFRHYGCNLQFYSENCYCFCEARYYGLTVRAVLSFE